MSDLSSTTLDAALAEVAEWVAAVNYEQAIARCNELISSYPDAVRVYRARASAYELSGDATHAIDDYTRVLDIVPADARAMVGLARSQLIAGQPRDVHSAEIVARQALDYDPANSDALQIAGDTDETSAPTGQIAFARARFSAGLANRAMTVLRRLGAAQPDRVDIQVILAEFMWRNGLKIATAELCQSILDQEPDCLNAHVILAALWTQIGNTPLAELHTRAVDRLDPDHRETQAWLADRSPFTVREVPPFIQPESQQELEAADEEGDGERDRSAWVDDLIAASSPVTPVSAEAAPATAPRADDADQYEGEIAGTAPLEWMPAGGDDSSDEDVPAWLTSLRAEAAKDDVAANVKKAAPVPPVAHESRAAEYDITPLAWAPDDIEEALPPVMPVTPDVADEPPQPVAVAAPEPQPEAQIDVSAEPVVMPEAPAPEAPAPDVSLAQRVKPRKRLRKPAARAGKARPGHDEALALARKAIETGRYDEAAEYYTNLIASGKKLDSILADLDVATHAYPDVRRFHALLGDVYTRKGDVNAALMAYHRALESQ
jgi:tetratricopeptide (TPR) repeat protein